MLNKSKLLRMYVHLALHMCKHECIIATRIKFLRANFSDVYDLLRIFDTLSFELDGMGYRYNGFPVGINLIKSDCVCWPPVNAIQFLLSRMSSIQFWFIIVEFKLSTLCWLTPKHSHFILTRFLQRTCAMALQ